MRAALRRGLFAVDGREPASRGSGNRALARLLVVPAACAACEELKTFAAGRGLTEWGLWCVRRSWRVPAGERPARVRP
jgi:hypothetical protein